MKKTLSSLLQKSKQVLSFFYRNQQVTNLLAVAVITLIIPLTVFVASQQQETRQFARGGLPEMSEGDQEECWEDDGYYDQQSIEYERNDERVCYEDSYVSQETGCVYQYKDPHYHCDEFDRDDEDDDDNDERDDDEDQEENACADENRVGKCNIAGQEDPACCENNDQCSNGQACNIGNGYCRSGNSCGDVEQVRSCEQEPYINKCVADDDSGDVADLCCGANSDCANGQECRDANGYCASGLSCTTPVSSDPCEQDPNHPKCNQNGLYDEACCVADSDCNGNPSGNTCGYGNGACRSGSACGPAYSSVEPTPQESDPGEPQPTIAAGVCANPNTIGKCDIDANWNGACCETDNHCSNGQICSSGNGYCRSGFACEQPPIESDPNDESPTDSPLQPQPTTPPSRGVTGCQIGNELYREGQGYCDIESGSAAQVVCVKRGGVYEFVSLSCGGSQACSVSGKNLACIQAQNDCSAVGLLEGDSKCMVNNTQRYACVNGNLIGQQCECTGNDGSAVCVDASAPEPIVIVEPTEIPEPLASRETFCTSPQGQVGEYICSQNANGYVWNQCVSSLTSYRWNASIYNQGCSADNQGERTTNVFSGTRYTPSPTPTDAPALEPTAIPIPQPCSFGNGITLNPNETRCSDTEVGGMFYSCYVNPSTNKAIADERQCPNNYSCNSAHTACATSEIKTPTATPTTPPPGDECAQAGSNTTFCGKKDGVDAVIACGVKKVSSITVCGSNEVCYRNGLTGNTYCTPQATAIPTPTTVQPITCRLDGITLQANDVECISGIMYACPSSGGTPRQDPCASGVCANRAQCQKAEPTPTPVVLTGCTSSWVGGEPRSSGGIGSYSCGSGFDDKSVYECGGGSAGRSGWQKSYSCRSGEFCGSGPGLCYTPRPVTIPTPVTVKCGIVIDDVYVPCAGGGGGVE